VNSDKTQNLLEISNILKATIKKYEYDIAEKNLKGLNYWENVLREENKL
jgi:hypothetical protein